MNEDDIEVRIGKITNELKSLIDDIKQNNTYKFSKATFDLAEQAAASLEANSKEIDKAINNYRENQTCSKKLVDLAEEASKRLSESEICKIESLIPLFIRFVKEHQFCGDQYPEQGWPDANAAIALYKLMKHKKVLAFKANRKKGPKPFGQQSIVIGNMFFRLASNENKKIQMSNKLENALNAKYGLIWETLQNSKQNDKNN